MFPFIRVVCCCCCCCFDCLWDDLDWRMWCLWIAGCPCTEKGSCSNRSSRETIGVSTLWLFNIAIGNGPFRDGLPIKNVQSWTNYLCTIPRISVGHVKHSGHCSGRLLAKKCALPYRMCRCLIFFSGLKKRIARKNSKYMNYLHPQDRSPLKLKHASPTQKNMLLKSPCRSALIYACNVSTHSASCDLVVWIVISQLPKNSSETV